MPRTFRTPKGVFVRDAGDWYAQNRAYGTAVYQVPVPVVYPRLSLYNNSSPGQKYFCTSVLADCFFNSWVFLYLMQGIQGNPVGAVNAIDPSQGQPTGAMYQDLTSGLITTPPFLVISINAFGFAAELRQPWLILPPGWSVVFQSAPATEEALMCAIGYYPSATY